jgi:hypothetical protein
MDFSAAAVTIEKVSKLELAMSYAQTRTEIPYAGKGVYRLNDFNVELASAPWGFDERYKLAFVVDGVEEDWGQLGPFSDPRPAIGQAGYRDMKPTAVGQWNGDQFKFPNELCDGANLTRYTVDFVVYMNNAKKNYTHDFLNIRG